MFGADSGCQDKVNSRQGGEEDKQLVIHVAGCGLVWWPPHRVHVQCHYGDHFDYAWKERERERVELIKIIIVGVVFLALFQQRTTAIVNNGVSK